MGIFELFILAVGLSMDAFAVAICKGLSLKKVCPRHMVIVGLWFGGFQALMPLIGYLVGAQFRESITAFDHWIAFVLLALIGGNMIREAFSKEEECDECSNTDNSLHIRSMFPMAVATSIDALAVGVSFAFLKVEIVPAISFIGVITFLLSGLGVKIGSLFGLRFKSKAELAGGIILILIGLKILLEHLGILAF
jgi:putative Mn2+ efflux pump MntP